MLDRFRAFWTKVISPVAHLLIKLGVSNRVQVALLVHDATA